MSFIADDLPVGPKIFAAFNAGFTRTPVKTCGGRRYCLPRTSIRYIVAIGTDFHTVDPMGKTMMPTGTTMQSPWIPQQLPLKASRRIWLLAHSLGCFMTSISMTSGPETQSNNYAKSVTCSPSDSNEITPSFRRVFFVSAMLLGCLLGLAERTRNIFTILINHPIRKKTAHLYQI
ncbi:hypothetical protein MQE22_01350 [Acidithiobacillus sp. YTS05]|uniref:Uncharacterized protein n=1 Tax=Igneacidithiobacillus copahuensis TaxID=2724909 RepID=A0AAE3CJR1_9PROT|nr:hypothetical protein [Igneacidithiobacillus copahuensis]UTV81288.1 hypothetical protein MQE22_01350 [Acidithiobacillus sp. YTS05]